jgi:hypothetical protein
METAIPPILPTTPTQHPDSPITEELALALRAGARKRSPGIDGMALELYIDNWEVI